MRNKLHYLPVFLFIAVFARTSMAHAQNYTDMSLEQAISVAEEKNRVIINAREDVEKANFQITEAASAAYPSINGFWDFDKVLKPMVLLSNFRILIQVS